MTKFPLVLGSCMGTFPSVLGSSKRGARTPVLFVHNMAVDPLKVFWGQLRPGLSKHVFDAFLSQWGCPERVKTYMVWGLPA